MKKNPAFDPTLNRLAVTWRDYDGRYCLPGNWDLIGDIADRLSRHDAVEDVFIWPLWTRGIPRECYRTLQTFGETGGLIYWGRELGLDLPPAHDLFKWIQRRDGGFSGSGIRR